MKCFRGGTEKSQSHGDNNVQTQALSHAVDVQTHFPAPAWTSTHSHALACKNARICTIRPRLGTARNTIGNPAALVALEPVPAAELGNQGPKVLALDGRKWPAPKCIRTVSLYGTLGLL